MKGKLIIIFLFLTMTSCTTRSSYIDFRGNPTYKITLISASGDPLQVRYAHSKYDDWNFGMYKSYEFRYWRWNYYKDSKKYGSVSLVKWHWDKDKVIIERGDYEMR